MKTVELIVSSLRRSGALIFKNIWLLGWALLYSFIGPLCLLGGTGLPILVWWASGRNFQPSMLFNDPAGFVLSHWPMILWSAAGCLVGFIVLLLVLLFYQGALTGVVVRGVVQGGNGAEKVSASNFFSEGSGLFGSSAGIATLASLFPLLPAVLLLVFVIILSFNVADLVSSQLAFRSPLILISVVGAVVTGVLTFLTGWIAFIWYKLGLAASRVKSLAPGESLGRAWKFFTERWGLVLCFVLATILLGLLSWGITAPFSMGGRMLGGWSEPLGMALQIAGAPLGFALGLFMDLWLDCAIVVLFIDNRVNPSMGEPVSPPAE